MHAHSLHPFAPYLCVRARACVCARMRVRVRVRVCVCVCACACVAGAYCRGAAAAWARLVCC